jgi:hypothetical protein
MKEQQIKGLFWNFEDAIQKWRRRKKKEKDKKKVADTKLEGCWPCAPPHKEDAETIQMLS